MLYIMEQRGRAAPPSGDDGPDDGVVTPAAVGSRARDHLANERTYLAWVRTAAAVMALGLAIAGFGRSTTATSLAAGAILVVTGVAGVAYGTVRYRQVTADLDAGIFRTTGRSRSALVAST